MLLDLILDLLIVGDLLVFRSDPPLPEVFQMSCMMPSAHLRPREFRLDLDPTISKTLSSSDSDDRVTLADLVKGKTGGVESSAREESPCDTSGVNLAKGRQLA